MPVYITSAKVIGDLFQAQLTVRSTAGTATNSAVTLNVRTPSGVTSTWTAGPSTAGSTKIEHIGTGVWVARHKTTEAGRYLWNFRSTGAVTSSTGGAFAVRRIYTSTSFGD